MSNILCWSWIANLIKKLYQTNVCRRIVLNWIILLSLGFLFHLFTEGEWTSSWNQWSLLKFIWTFEFGLPKDYALVKEWLFISGWLFYFGFTELVNIYFCHILFILSNLHFTHVINGINGCMIESSLCFIVKSVWL